ncbi:MAG: hypothetical protein OXU61_04540 [Gammaproteobacteria bacterium]|nr:hypothetical protein [Gammaproteobacteria bacterium]
MPGGPPLPCVVLAPNGFLPRRPGCPAPSHSDEPAGGGVFLRGACSCADWGGPRTACV